MRQTSWAVSYIHQPCLSNIIVSQSAGDVTSPMFNCYKKYRMEGQAIRNLEIFPHSLNGKNIIVAIAGINTRSFTNNVILELFIAR